MRVLLTGIPSYLTRTVDKVSGSLVAHKPYFEPVRTKEELIQQIKKIANTGNYLIGEGAAHSLRGHQVTYVPFWHLVNNIGSEAVYDHLRQAFDICVFSSANLLRPGYSAEMESRVFEALRLPVVVMGVGIQRKANLRADLPEGTVRFLDVMKDRQSFFLTRGYDTAEFLGDYGMSFVRPTGCPSLFFAPHNMKRALAGLANPDLCDSQRIVFGGYLGSVADTIVDAHALLGPGSRAQYVVQDEVVVYNMDIVSDNGSDVYDQDAGRIIAQAQYKHSDAWQRQCELYVFFDTNRWRTWVSAQDFCFGRRFHGCVIGMQAGVPSLMIAVDDRMREMLSFIGFPHIEAAVWNREGQKKKYLKEFLAEVDVNAALDRYEECEAGFHQALGEVGIC